MQTAERGPRDGWTQGCDRWNLEHCMFLAFSLITSADHIVVVDAVRQHLKTT